MEDSVHEKDVFPTMRGDLAITFLGHGSLMIQIAGKVIHVDPFSRVADYAQLPKADLVLITHEHRDHLDPEALRHILKASTTLLLTHLCAAQFEHGTVLKNGDTFDWDGIIIQAVPAYNLVHKRENGLPFHPKGDGNGYVVAFGEVSVYIAGDTENIPEMADLQNIQIAFLPMNLPYTMTPEMAAQAARSFMPHILYPYHYGSTDASTLMGLLKATGIDVRIRNLA